MIVKTGLTTKSQISFFIISFLRPFNQTNPASYGLTLKDSSRQKVNSQIMQKGKNLTNGKTKFASNKSIKK